MVDIDRIFITYYFKRIIITNEDLIFGKISRRNFFSRKFLDRSSVDTRENFLPFPSLRIFIPLIEETYAVVHAREGKINWSLRSECRRRSKKPMLRLLREYWSTGNVSRNRQRRRWVETLRGQ